MNTEKLFKVLVVGGGILAGSANADVAFCSPDDEETCVRDETGQLPEREGVVCCWGTSCNGEPK